MRMQTFVAMALTVFSTTLGCAPVPSNRAAPPPEIGFSLAPSGAHIAKFLSQEQLIGQVSPFQRQTIRQEVDELGYAKSLRIGANPCSECHPDVAQQWSKSAHRFSSFNNPFYAASINKVLDAPSGRVKGRFCAGCHDPALLLTGTFDKQFDPRDASAQAGLTCLACHGIRGTVDQTGNGNYIMGAGLFDSDDRLLQKDGKTFISDPTAIQLHRKNMQGPIRTPEFCGACHKASIPGAVNGDGWFRGQNDYDDWHQSGVSGKAARLTSVEQARECRDCHMPLESATLGDLAAKNGVVRSHRFIAANSALPAIRHDDETIARIETFLKGQLSVDIAAIRHIDELSRPAMLPDETTPDLPAESTLVAEVVVRNLGVGHGFPGGTIDINEAWLEFTIVDSSQNPIGSNGKIDAMGTVDPDAHRFGVAILNDDGEVETSHDVAKFRTVLWKQVIGFGESDLVRYRFRLPATMQGSRATLGARLRFRKFSEAFRRFACETNSKGFPTGCPSLPIVDIASTTVTLPIVESGHASWKPLEPRPQTSSTERVYAYALAAIQQGDVMAAESALNLLKQQSRADLMTNVIQARLLVMLGRATEALALLDGLSSTDPRARWVEMTALTQLRKYDAAADAANWLLQSRPDDRNIWFFRGDALMRLGSAPREAQEAFNRVLEIDPENAQAYYLRAQLRTAANDIPGATDDAAKHRSLVRSERVNYADAIQRAEYRKLHHRIDRDATALHWHDAFNP